MFAGEIPSTRAQAPAFAGFASRKPVSFCGSHTCASPLPPYRPGVVPLATGMCASAVTGMAVRSWALFLATESDALGTVAAATDSVKGFEPGCEAGMSATGAEADVRPIATPATTAPATRMIAATIAPTIHHLRRLRASGSTISGSPYARRPTTAGHKGDDKSLLRLCD